MGLGILSRRHRHFGAGLDGFLTARYCRRTLGNGLRSSELCLGPLSFQDTMLGAQIWRHLPSGTAIAALSHVIAATINIIRIIVYLQRIPQARLQAGEEFGSHEVRKSTHPSGLGACNIWR